MKKLSFLIFLAVIFSNCQDFQEQESQTIPEEDTFATRAAVSDDYYYGSDRKIPIVKSADKSYVLYKADVAKLQKSLSVVNLSAISNSQDYKLIIPNDKKNVNLFEGLKSGTGKAADLAKVTKLDEVVYAAPYYIFNDDGKEYPLTNIFYVELKSPEDVGKLEKVAAENNVTIVHRIPLTDNAYTLSCTKESQGNALEMANLFYETGLFLSSAPEFLALEDFCVDDNYFPDQWNLNNTGQYGGTVGVDIGYCDARTITTGSSNIIVAVIDKGAPTDHPDLNIYKHHDAISKQDISNVVDDHGTAVIGIINAQANNGKGIAGIAPGCRLLSISRNETEEVAAYALRYAADNGARVINCSWGSPFDSSVLNSAVRYALNKGCVVVFAAGNSNLSAVSYPGAVVSEVITVGAISFNGMRKSLSTPDGENWGSNYGSELDVVAPGVLIPTVDRPGNVGYNPAPPPFFGIHLDAGGLLVFNDYTDRDYTVWFSQTSSAAPQVAGIAALVLSLNPLLTRQQVTDMIIQSGNLYPNRNNEYGYGLVDAHKAVTASLNTFLSNWHISGRAEVASYTDETYSFPPPPSAMTFRGWTITPSAYTVTGGTGSTTLNIRFNATGPYTLKANFTKPDGTLYSLTKTVVSHNMSVPVITWNYESGQPAGPAPWTARVRVLNVQYGMEYEWNINGMAQFNSPSSPTSMYLPAVNNGDQFVVSCRARQGIAATAWGNTVIITAP